MIKAKDPWFHCISVAYEGFVILEGIPILEGTPLTQPFFVATPSIGASSSQLILQEEEEEEEGEEEEEQQQQQNPEGIVTLSESSEEFEEMGLIEHSPEEIHWRSPRNQNFPHLLPNLFFLLLSHLCQLGLIELIRRGKKSRREKK